MLLVNITIIQGLGFLRPCYLKPGLPWKQAQFLRPSVIVTKSDLKDLALRGRCERMA